MDGDPDVAFEVEVEAFCRHVEDSISKGSTEDLNRRALGCVEAAFTTADHDEQRKVFREVYACLGDGRIDPQVAATLCNELKVSTKRETYTGDATWFASKDEEWKQAFAHECLLWDRVKAARGMDGDTLDAGTAIQVFSLPAGRRVVRDCMESSVFLTPEHPAVVDAALYSPNPFTRGALAREGDIDLTSEQCRTLFEDPSAEVRKAAVSRLFAYAGQAGDVPFVKALTVFAADPCEAVREHAAGMVIYGNSLSDRMVVLLKAELERSGNVVDSLLLNAVDERMSKVSSHERLEHLASATEPCWVQPPAEGPTLALVVPSASIDPGPIHDINVAERSLGLAPTHEADRDRGKSR